MPAERAGGLRDTPDGDWMTADRTFLMRCLGLAPRGSVAAVALETPSSRAATPISLEPCDRRFLRAVSIDLSGRTPLPKEWSEAQGRPRTELLRGHAAGLPAWEGFYEEELFYFL